MSNRRQFLREGLLAATALPLLWQKALAAAPEMLKTSDPQAQALGYHEDATKVNAKKFPKRADTEGRKQFCWNCQFYQSKNADPKKDASAPCTIFANKLVKGKGWCASWMQNPKLKT